MYQYHRQRVSPSVRVSNTALPLTRSESVSLQEEYSAFHSMLQHWLSTYRSRNLNYRQLHLRTSAAQRRC